MTILGGKTHGERLKTRIVRGDRHFIVSTCPIIDASWETMVFECDADGENVNYLDLYCKRYNNYLAAIDGHTLACETFQPPVRVESDDYDASRHDYSDDDGMTDAEADADTLRSCGWGTDEDYGYYGDD